MAKAKKTLDFTPVRREVLVEFTKLRNLFDVREDAHGSAQTEHTIDELVNQWATQKISVLPLVTKDFVYIDGRTGGEAQARLDTLTVTVTPDKPHVVKILVDMVDFAYDTLPEHQKDQVRAEALRRNLPARGSSYRDFADEGDIKFNIEKLITGEGAKELDLSLEEEDGAAMKAYVAAVLQVGKGPISVTRFGKLYPNVVNSVEQKMLDACRKLKLVKPTYTDEKVAEIIGLPARLVGSIVTGKRGGKTKHLNALIEKQTTLDSALKSLEKYAKGNMKLFKAGRLSGKSFLELTAYHKQTAMKLMRKIEEIEKRVAEAVAELDGFHRV